MKKVLFATTALVAFSGAAAAEVALSGYAEIGIQDGDAVDTQFHHDIDVKFSLSGETDGGLAFGATIDLDEVGDDCTLTASVCTGGDPISNRSGEHSVYVRGEFGNITMGDTDGAFDWALQEVAQLTALADDHSSHAGYSGNSGLDGTYDGQIARYDYSFGDFAFGLSAELDDAGAGDPVWGLGFKYSGAMGGLDLGVGLGYQTDGIDNIVGISADIASNGFSAIVNYSDLDSGGDHAGIGLGYTTGALSLHANYGRYEVAGVDTDGFGLAVNYDLGGGAVAMLGYGSGDAPSGNGNGDDTWSAGLGLSF